MRTSSARGLRPWAAPLLAAAMLAGLSTAATARTRWSVDLNLGFPLIGAPVYGGPGYGYGGYNGYGGYVNALPAGAVSLQIGGGRYWRHGGMWYRPYGPRWVVVAPPLVYPTVVQTEPVVMTPPLPVAPSRPDPVIYPRNGQDAQQTELDRQECNRWATTQPAALADASVFHRAVEACMDGRGYSMK